MAGIRINDGHLRSEQDKPLTGSESLLCTYSIWRAAEMSFPFLEFISGGWCGSQHWLVETLRRRCGSKSTCGQPHETNMHPSHAKIQPR